MLSLYLLSSPHSTIAGVFRCPDGYVSDDLQWTSGRVSKGFENTSERGFATRCETTKWVWIRKFLEWNAPEGPNQWKAARKIAAQIPDQCTWKAEFLRVFAKSAGDPEPPQQEPIPNPSGTPTQAHPDSGAGAGAGTRAGDGSRSAAAAPLAEPMEFVELQSIYPSRAGSQRWPDALKAIRARLAEGSTWNEILNGARRYAAFIRATGKERTEYVLQAATFCGKGREYQNLWAPPAEKENVMDEILRRAGRGPAPQFDSTVIDHDEHFRISG